jgi:hypothetical protein
MIYEYRNLFFTFVSPVIRPEMSEESYTFQCIINLSKSAAKIFICNFIGRNDSLLFHSLNIWSRISDLDLHLEISNVFRLANIQTHRCKHIGMNACMHAHTLLYWKSKLFSLLCKYFNLHILLVRFLRFSDFSEIKFTLTWACFFLLVPIKSMPNCKQKCSLIQRLCPGWWVKCMITSCQQGWHKSIWHPRWILSIAPTLSPFNFEKLVLYSSMNMGSAFIISYLVYIIKRIIWYLKFYIALHFIENM